MVQSTKACTSLGFEKYCNTLTMAEVMLPNIIPMMSNDAVSFIWGAIAKIMKIITEEPANAERASPTLPLNDEKMPMESPPARVNNATPKLAPVLTPST